MNKAYFAGILTGALCTLAGYVMGHSSPLAMAAPAGDGSSGGYIMTTAPNGANERMVYIWDSTDPAKPRLSVYSVEQGKELQLRSHRLCTYDKLFDVYEMGGKPDAPEDMKKRFDALKPK